MTMASAYVRSGLFLLTALVLHLALFSDLRVLGVAPEVPLAIAVTAGLAGGPERGAVAGFVIGLGIDLYLPTLFGLSALIYTVWGYSVGLLEERIFRSAWWINVLVTAAATAGGCWSMRCSGSCWVRPTSTPTTSTWSWAWLRHTTWS